MASTLRAGGPAVAAGPIVLRELAVRLLERTFAEFAPVERAFARFAADRTLDHLAACCELLAAAIDARGTEQVALLLAAEREAGAARADLEWVRAQGAVLPPAIRMLVGGCDVLRRRIEELRRARACPAE